MPDDPIQNDDVVWLRAYDARELLAEHTTRLGAQQSIATRAYAGLVRARARLLLLQVPRQRYGKTEVRKQEYKEIPTNFWWAKGHEALEQNWNAGDFSTWIDKTYHYQAFGVEFERGGILEMLPPKIATIPQVQPKPDEQGGCDELPPLPTDQEIIAKMQEMSDFGMRREGIAIFIRQVVGFQRVGNDHARRLFTGIKSRGRPRKQRA